MHAPPKPDDIPLITPDILGQYDGFLFGIPTRYGNFPAQWKTFWDSTGQIWQKGGYWGKYGGVFVSTSTQGGGQEATVIAALSTFAHHGIIYVPLGYKTVFPALSNLSEVRGGTPWGAGTFSVSVLQTVSPHQRHFISLLGGHMGLVRLTFECRAVMVLVNRLPSSWR